VPRENLAIMSLFRLSLAHASSRVYEHACEMLNRGYLKGMLATQFRKVRLPMI
jgi:hypothetical protein